jgi:hypothetical protein
MGEYYTSALISDMLSQKIYPFRGISITQDDFVCTGTPAQLIDFQRKLLHDPSRIKKRRICFDLDSTLVTIPKVPGDYSTCEPIFKNIKLVKQLVSLQTALILPIMWC